MTQVTQRNSQDNLLLALTCAVIALVLVQAVVGNAMEIHWDADPRASTTQARPTVFGPTTIAWISVLSAALSAAVLWAHGRAGGKVNVIACVLTAIGVVACLLHFNDHVEDLRRGGAWIGSAMLALSAFHLAQHERPRRYIVAALVALLVPWTIDSVMYVYHEIPMTIRHFYNHEDEFLRSRGWERGSPQHELYIRRLESPDAVGVIGLSNVFGSMAAALTVLAAAAAACSLRHGCGARSLVAGIAAVAGLVTVCLTHSKGAAVTVAAVVALLLFGLRWRRWLPAAAIALVVLAFAAVLVRGAVGPPDSHTGERSVLFRYQYWQATTRAIAEQPTVAGLGVAGFGRAYLRHKSPLNPEEVTSAHSVFVDYIAMLGIGGLAWTGLLLAGLWQAGRNVATDPPTQEVAAATTIAGRDVAAAVAIAALVFGAQFACEFIMLLSPESFLAWSAGVIGFIIVFSLLVTPGWLSRRGMNLGLLGAAAVMLVHNQIEMTFFQVGGATLAMTIVAVAAARSSEPSDRPTLAAPFAAIVCAALAVYLIVTLALPITRQQQAMASATNQLRTHNVSATMQTLDQAMTLLPTDPEPTEQWVRLALQEAAKQMRSNRRDVAQQLLDGAMTRLDNSAHADDPAILRLRAQVHRYAAFWLRKPARLEQAAAVMERIIRAAPYSLQDHLRLADLYWQMNRHDDAGRIYRRCLELHDQSYLDPARQLVEKDLARVRQRAAGQ